MLKLLFDNGTFPSPCGEKVGINPGLTLKRPRRGLEVSVPLRGKGRDQLSFPNSVKQ